MHFWACQKSATNVERNFGLENFENQKTGSINRCVYGNKRLGNSGSEMTYLNQLLQSQQIDTFSHSILRGITESSGVLSIYQDSKDQFQRVDLVTEFPQDRYLGHAQNCISVSCYIKHYLICFTFFIGLGLFTRMHILFGSKQILLQSSKANEVPISSPRSKFLGQLNDIQVSLKLEKNSKKLK